jgi:hypothetical protein
VESGLFFYKKKKVMENNSSLPSSFTRVWSDKGLIDRSKKT